MMRQQRRDEWASLNPNSGKYESKGRIKVKKATAGAGEEHQRKRQERDNELREAAGQKSEYLHESTLSRPFGKAGRSVKQYDPTNRKELRKLEQERRRRRNKEQRKKGRSPLPTGLRRQILVRDDYRCRYCGNGHVDLHIDHVVPYSLGGKDTLGNLVTACSPCNLKKGVKTWVPSDLEKHFPNKHRC